MKGISIIIPCYNCELYIEDCVNSIINFGIQNEYEIIIINDCSIDKSNDILKKIKSVRNIFVFENEQNRGVQYSRNKGLELAKYDYVMMIDGDDMLNIKTDKNGITFIDKSIEILEKSTDIAFVHGIWKMFEDFNGYTITTYPLNEELIINKHHVQTSIIHRKNDNVFYDEEIKKWQDWSFAIALLNKRYKENKRNIIFFIEEAYYLYRIHSVGSRISTSNNISEYEMIEKTINKNSEIFYKYFPHDKLNKIVEKVYQKIPSKLESLLYVSNNNLKIARKMIKEREYYLESTGTPHSFP